MKRSDPDWYKLLQGDILKEQKFDNELMQKIRLRTTQIETIRTKNRLHQAAFASLASLIVVVAILFTVSETATHSSISQQNTNITEDGHSGGQANSEEIEELPELTDKDGDQLPGAVDLSKVPEDEIFIPKMINLPGSTNEQSYSEELKIFAQNTDEGLILRTKDFNTPTGVIFKITQAPATMSEDDTIQWLLTKAYTQNNKEKTEVEGHTVVYIEQKNRTVAHLITPHHFFTVTATNGTIEDCTKILMQLKPETETSSLSTTPNRIDLTMVKDTIHLPLNLVDPPLQHTQTSSTALQITKLVDAYGQTSINGETILVIYQLNDDKHEVIFTQSHNKFEDVQAAVEDTKSWYKSEDVKVMEINGCTAVIEDSPSRKQVHLITATHFYTIGSPGTLDLEYLIKLAGKIQSP
ncbi:hypothetical protein [Paenibacillus sp. ATY16]|uniref:hypothetical protein n=1 Tax=Paenibacillus sp. ATY16 TaxID=1759312 RepID=UPI00200D1579|nr:hypothetical protein [Paenibacillus sp. ATY16]MCK9858626.1 hypothetical protein [Paenibacillus sp. ATY16]